MGMTARPAANDRPADRATSFPKLRARLTTRTSGIDDCAAIKAGSDASRLPSLTNRIS